jgi:uncharacterized repeat protein (TIGR01451 family)
MRTTIRCITTRRCWLAHGVFALIALVMALNPGVAFAQGGVDDKNGVFQLEGNATTETSICFENTSAGAFTATPPCTGGLVLVTFGPNTDDWQTALTYPGHTTDGLPLAQSWVADNPNNDVSLFGGGTKDTNGFSSGPWEWNTSSVQDKDDILHSFSAAYKLPNGHIGIYFGMDRFSNSGDTTAGFWFLQDSTFGLSNTKKGGGMLFNGHHTNNDLLIVANYGTGGATPTVVVFTWSCSGTGATCDTTGSLVQHTIEQNAAAQCNPTTGTSTFCAITNGSNGITAPWGFLNKTGNTTYSDEEFLEGGLDLQTVFTNVPCFSLTFAETRASPSPTASLADFSPPVSFPLCGMMVSKSCNGVTANTGSAITYSYGATVMNTGIGSLFNITLHDTLPDGTTEDIAVPLPDTCNGVANSCLAAKDSATVTSIPFTATTTNCHTGVTNCTVPTDAINTATASAFTAANSGGSPVSSTPPAGTAECKTSVGGMVTVKKACDAANGGATLVQSSGEVVAEVFYTARVCNNTPAGTQGETLTGINLVDDHDGASDTPSPSSIASLAPGACTIVSGHYFPSAVDATTGRFGFTDVIRVTSATGALGVNPTPPGCSLAGGATTDQACDTITCPICFDSVCTGLPQPSDY